MRGRYFDPSGQTAQASLSRIVIGDVGCPEAAGLRAEDVCSRDALWTLAFSCGLEKVRPHRLADDIMAAAGSTDPVTRRAAAATIAGFGRRVGALIATLRHPSTVEWQGNIPARRTYLAHWLTVDRIWLAGGLLAGNGSTVAATAASWGAGAVRPCPVTLAPYPAVTPLLGAARLACDGDSDRAIAIADLGHTSIKTAVVRSDATAVTELRVVSVRAAPMRRSADSVERAVAAALVGVVRQAAADRSRSRVHLVVSIAAQVSDGRPVDDGAGVYGCLADRVFSLRRQIAAGSGSAVTLEFVHDGTSAAAAGTVNSATIMVGTWPGSGFHPAQAPPLAELAPDVSVHYA